MPDVLRDDKAKAGDAICEIMYQGDFSSVHRPSFLDEMVPLFSVKLPDGQAFGIPYPFTMRHIESVPTLLNRRRRRYHLNIPEVSLANLLHR